MLAQYFLPVDFLNLHLGLALGHEVRHVRNAAELAELVGRDVEAETRVDEHLEAHLVERVEGEVQLNVVGGADFARFLGLDVAFDDLVLVALRFLHDFGAVVLPLGDEGFELVAL